MGSNPAQGINSFSSNENVIQKLSVLGLFINLINYVIYIIYIIYMNEGQNGTISGACRFLQLHVIYRSRYKAELADNFRPLSFV